MKNDRTVKHDIVEIFRRSYPVTPIRGNDVIALNSKAVLYISYNNNKGPSANNKGQFFFGITVSEFNRYSSDNLFLICACIFENGDIDIINLPANDFKKLTNLIPVQSGQWKFTLEKKNDDKYLLRIARKGKVDVTDFLNDFDFTPPNLRRGHLPQLGMLQPSLQPDGATLDVGTSAQLEDEILLAATDSGNPSRFETAVERFFTELGFRCKGIGGSGDTDVLVYEPEIFIVEAKSTKSHAKSSLNFARIKRHMAEHSARFMVIASVGFDPAVCRDAELEGATLLGVDSMIELLSMRRDCILSPYDYIPLLSVAGAITKERLSGLRDIAVLRNSLFSRIITIHKNLDFAPKSLEILAGRIELFCEQNGLDKIDFKELEHILLLLSDDLLGLVERHESGFSKLYPDDTINSRIAGIVGCAQYASLTVSQE